MSNDIPCMNSDPFNVGPRVSRRFQDIARDNKRDRRELARRYGRNALYHGARQRPASQQTKASNTSPPQRDAAQSTEGCHNPASSSAPEIVQQIQDVAGPSAALTQPLDQQQAIRNLEIPVIPWFLELRHQYRQEELELPSTLISASVEDVYLPGPFPTESWYHMFTESVSDSTQDSDVEPTPGTSLDGLSSSSLPSPPPPLPVQRIVQSALPYMGPLPDPLDLWASRETWAAFGSRLFVPYGRLPEGIRELEEEEEEDYDDDEEGAILSVGKRIAGFLDCLILAA